MRTLTYLTVLFSFILSSCSSGVFVSSAYDDIYYKAGDEKIIEPSQQDNLAFSNQQDKAEIPSDNQNFYRNEEAPPPPPVDANYEQKANELTGRYQNYQSEPQSDNPQNQSYSSDYSFPDSTEYYQDESGNTYVTNNYYDDEDYYDYSYSSRLRRFHDPYFGCGYYDNYYTNSYWYSYDPWDWGWSIYLGYNFWYPYSYFRPSFGFSYGNPYWAWSYSYGYPYWGMGYGVGYNSWNAYNSGYHDGFWDGYYYANNTDYYYNSHDGTNYQYGHRQNKPTDVAVSPSTGSYSRPSRETNTLGQKYENSLLASRESRPSTQIGSFSNSRDSRENSITKPGTQTEIKNGRDNSTSLTSRPQSSGVNSELKGNQNIGNKETRNPQSQVSTATQVQKEVKPSQTKPSQAIPDKYRRPEASNLKYPAKTPETYTRDNSGSRPNTSKPDNSSIRKPDAGNNQPEKPRYNDGNSPNRYNNSSYPGSYGRPQKENSQPGYSKKPGSGNIESKPRQINKPVVPKESYSRPQGNNTDNYSPSRSRESSSSNQNFQSAPRQEHSSSPAPKSSSSGSGFSRSGSSGSSSSSGSSVSRGNSGSNSNSSGGFRRK